MGHPDQPRFLHIRLVILALHSTQNCQLSLEGKGFYWAICITLVGHGWETPQKLLVVSETGQDWSGLSRLPAYVQAAQSPYWCPASFSKEISDLPASLQQELTLWVISILFCFRMTMDALQLANTAFAVDMFKKLCEKDRTANIVFAPLCTSTSLALAYKATKGDTADQMKKVSCRHPAM